MSDRIKNDVNHPRVAIGILSWIEDNSQLPELKRCLDSLVDFYPVINVGGKWNDIEGTQPRSTQEAQDLIESYSNVISYSSPNKPEYMNRNECLINAGKMLCDYLIWVDTDEWVELPCGKEWFLRNLKETFSNPRDFCARVWFDEGTSRRIIRYPMFVRMRGKHNEWFFGERDVRLQQLKPIDGLIIHHDKKFRSKDRENKMFIRNRDNPIH